MIYISGSKNQNLKSALPISIVMFTAEERLQPGMFTARVCLQPEYVYSRGMFTAGVLL